MRKLSTQVFLLIWAVVILILAAKFYNNYVTFQQSWTGIVSCTLEDASSPNQQLPCKWDAERQGNGLGKSFVVNKDGSFDYR